jgi:adenosylmethionine-8-amino-7-oxononanoate aminotransferase
MNLAELDKRHVWHPFTQMQQWLEDDPLVIERGEGIYRGSPPRPFHVKHP